MAVNNAKLYVVRRFALVKIDPENHTLLAGNDRIQTGEATKYISIAPLFFAATFPR
jgi:hypothetical protein